MTAATPHPPPDRNSAEHGGARPSGPANWQKVLGILGLAAAVVVAIMMSGDGGHGPGRHAPGGGAPADTEHAAAGGNH